MPSLDETELACRLAARLCHDFVGPAGGVVSGLDLLAASPSAEIGEAARELIDQGARRLLALIVFSRAAYGWDDQTFDAEALEALVRGLFRDQRASLEWAVEPPALPAAAARMLLVLTQLAADAVAAGGEARVSVRGGSAAIDIRVLAEGPRVRLHPDVAAGLTGQTQDDGMSGRWIQARFAHALAAKSGGAVSAAAASEDGGAKIRFSAHLPRRDREPAP